MQVQLMASVANPNPKVSILNGIKMVFKTMFMVTFMWFVVCFLKYSDFSYSVISSAFSVCAYVCIYVSFSVPGPVLETTVGEDLKSMLLRNLLSGTEYSVEVTASYPTGQSEPQLVNAKTCKHP